MDLTTTSAGHSRFYYRCLSFNYYREKTSLFDNQLFYVYLGSHFFFFVYSTILAQVEGEV